MAELKKLLIETPVDKLVELVARKKNLRLKDAAKLIGVEEETIEEWVGVLETYGYLKINYTPFGSPLIEMGDVKIPHSPEGIETEEEVSEQRAEKLENAIAETKEKIKIIRKTSEREAAEKHKRILVTLARAHRIRGKALKTGKKKHLNAGRKKHR